MFKLFDVLDKNSLTTVICETERIFGRQGPTKWVSRYRKILRYPPVLPLLHIDDPFLPCPPRSLAGWGLTRAVGRSENSWSPSNVLGTTCPPPRDLGDMGQCSGPLPAPLAPGSEGPEHSDGRDSFRIWCDDSTYASWFVYTILSKNR